MTADDYVKQVLDRLPASMPRRAQIGVELRGHIAEKMAAGHTLDDVLQQLGDPATLANSYLAEVPLVAAPLGRRIGAKLTDIVLVCVVVGLIAIPAAWAVALLDKPDLLPVLMSFGLLFMIVGGSLLFGVYTVVAEWQWGQTIGKRWLDLRVVQESGARIGLGQSIVRQLPAPLQIFWIDAMFVLFTDRSQRAFEVLSKTRTVVAE
jgi:uncharacterized RDD family membrane protein YckC